MLDGISEHICVLEAAGTIIAVNSAWQAFGAANGADDAVSAVGVSYLDVCDRAALDGSRDAEAVAAGLRRLLGGGGPVDFEFEYPCHAPGEQRWFSARARSLSGGGPMRVLVIHRDITQARSAQAALMESEEHYRMLFDNSIDGVLHTRPDGTVLAANPAACAILRMPESEVCRRGRRGLVDPEDGRLKAALKHRAKGGASRGVLTLIRGDGSRFEAELSSSEYADSQGRANACVVLRDLTERLAAEKARSELEGQLREAQKMESIGTLAGGIAHDFNNILAAILGCASLAQAEVPEESPAHALLQTIGRAAHRGRDLVQQILSFSRRQPQQPQSVQSVSKLLDDVVALLRSTLPAGIHLVLQPCDPALSVRANAAQLQQVLMNLGVNAWHAIQRPTGHIVFSASAHTVDGAPGDAPVVLPPGDYVRLDVADDGCGMTDAVRERIFEPFFTTKAVGAGTGLGLSVAHGIVQEHHGAISVDSAPGSGTTFHVWLPLVAPPDTVAQESGLGALASEHGDEHVFVVEDDELMRLVTERILRRKGYRVTCFAGPHEALQALRADPQGVDLVLTDYNMPEGSGVELARAIGALRPELPVVISSGLVGAEVEQQALAAGAARVVHKERFMEDLGSVLRSVLDAAA